MGDISSNIINTSSKINQINLILKYIIRMSASTFNLSQNAQQQTLNNVQTLQQLEKELYKNLEKMTANNENKDLQKKLINKISDISQTRIALFEQLQSMYLTAQDNVKDKKDNLVDQLTLLGLVEKEMKNNKARMGTVSKYNYNNVRQAEINTYYNKKYKFYNEILKIAIYLCISLLVVVFLWRLKILPDIFAQGLGIIGIIVCGTLITIKVVDLSRRKNNAFDEYDVPFDPSTADLAPPSDKKSDDFVKIKGDFGKPFDSLNIFSNKGDICEGENCCGAGLEFNNDRGICVIPSASTSLHAVKNKSSDLFGNNQVTDSDDDDTDAKETESKNNNNGVSNTSTSATVANSLEDSDDSLDD